MRHLISLMLLALCTSATAHESASSVVSNQNSSTVTSSTSSQGAGSVILDNQSSVTSSVSTDGQGAVTNSIVGRTGSMCSAVINAQRCEISCQAPEVAHCSQPAHASEPLCLCK